MAEMLSTVKDFVSTLKDKIEKKDVIDDLSDAFSSLAYYTYPMYKLEVAKRLDTSRNNPVSKTLVNALKGVGIRTENPFTDIHHLMEELLKNEDKIIEVVTKAFGNVRLREGMDYKTINILYYINNLAFFVETARYYIMGAIALEYKESEIFKPMSAIDKYHVEITTDNKFAMSFAKSVELLSLNIDVIVRGLRDLDGYRYDEDHHDEIMSRNSKEVDPYKIGFLPVWLNPVYHLGLALNAWRNKRNEKARLEKERFEFIVMAINDQLDMEKNGEEKAKLKKQMSYYSNRINKLDMEIEEYEKR